MDSGEVFETVTRVWCELLETAEVNADQDFIAAGGDSLLVVEMLARLEEAFPDAGLGELEDFGWLTIRTTTDRIVASGANQ